MLFTNNKSPFCEGNIYIILDVFGEDAMESGEENGNRVID